MKTPFITKNQSGNNETLDLDSIEISKDGKNTSQVLLNLFRVFNKSTQIKSPDIDAKLKQLLAQLG